MSGIQHQESGHPPENNTAKHVCAARVATLSPPLQRMPPVNCPPPPLQPPHALIPCLHLSTPLPLLFCNAATAAAYGITPCMQHARACSLTVLVSSPSVVQQVPAFSVMVASLDCA
eukprot:360834-Chlamydomonas_euryale.AAC.2